jgi:hypothetical protein
MREVADDSLVKVSQVDYDLAMTVKATRERLCVPPGVVGTLLGVFHCGPEALVDEPSGDITVYHPKKIGKRLAALTHELCLKQSEWYISVLGVERRPKLGPGRRHTWARRTEFRTLLRNSGPVRDFMEDEHDITFIGEELNDDDA